MINREYVIKALECCTDGFMMCKRERCPYYGKAPIDSTCRIELEKDAIVLLKAQEPVKPILYSGAIEFYRCGQCNEPIDRCDNYCWSCGRAVKWDD